MGWIWPIGYPGRAQMTLLHLIWQGSECCRALFLSFFFYPHKKGVASFPTEPFGNHTQVSLLLSNGATHAAGWSYRKISHSNRTRSSPLALHQFLM